MSAREAVVTGVALLSIALGTPACRDQATSTAKYRGRRPVGSGIGLALAHG